MAWGSIQTAAFPATWGCARCASGLRGWAATLASPARLARVPRFAPPCPSTGSLCTPRPTSEDTAPEPRRSEPWQTLDLSPDDTLYCMHEIKYIYVAIG